MAKFVEMDERIKFKDQTDEKIEGPVILINKFNVHPDKLQEFLNDWADDAIGFKRQQGFVSAQLHKGVGKSSVFVNYAVWESRWNIISKQSIKYFLAPNHNHDF
jgi:quinol monooxygenase YgiN